MYIHVLAATAMYVLAVSSDIAAWAVQLVAIELDVPKDGVAEPLVLLMMTNCCPDCAVAGSVNVPPVQ